VLAGERQSGSSHRLRLRRRALAIAAGAMANMASAMVVAAQEPAAKGITPPSIATSLPSNGDGDGRRKALADRGVLYAVMYTNDLLANVQGGTKRGTIDQGKVEGTISFDLEKLAGWKDLSFFANGFQIHNSGRIRRDYVGGINTIAAIEAVPALRLSEIWLERKFMNGEASIRVGQLAADVEFFYAATSFLFLQSDWATITAVNQPSGGPAYPLSTPGARVKWDPNKNVSVLLAVFNGDPAGPGDGDEQLRNRHGLNFRVRDPALVIGEAQFRANQAKADTGLARTIKIGAWGHFGSFDDKRFAFDGTLLPASVPHQIIPAVDPCDRDAVRILHNEAARNRLGDPRCRKPALLGWVVTGHTPAYHRNKPRTTLKGPSVLSICSACPSRLSALPFPPGSPLPHPVHVGSTSPS
jgi:porin